MSLNLSVEALEILIEKAANKAVERLVVEQRKNKLLSLSDTEKMLGVTYHTLLRWEKADKIKTHRIGRNKFYFEDEIISLLRTTT